jgi:hypothetical protein
LFRHDPIGINFDHNTDEYEPETGTILPRLRTVDSADAVVDVVYGEFQKWFTESAGDKENYREIAQEVWTLWERRKDNLR